MQRGIVALAVLSSISAMVAAGQPQPRTFFKQRVGLKDSEIQKISQGQVVTKVLEAGDKQYGVLVFGAVYVNVPVSRFPDVVRNTKALLSNKVYQAVREFSPNGAPTQTLGF